MKNISHFKIGEWAKFRNERLRNMYPEEWEFMSMKEIIIKHYGLKAMQLIESVL